MIKWKERLSMTQASFDSVTSTKRLKDSGFSEDQAEAITIVIQDWLEGDIATKADITKLQNELNKSIAEFKIEINRNLYEFKVEINRNLSEFRTETNRNLYEFKVEINRNLAEFKLETNENLIEFKVETNRNLSEFRAETNNNFATIKTNFKWVFWIGGAIVGLLVIPWIQKIFEISGL